jgi:hypothetical protein
MFTLHVELRHNEQVLHDATAVNADDVIERVHESDFDLTTMELGSGLDAGFLEAGPF